MEMDKIKAKNFKVFNYIILLFFILNFLFHCAKKNNEIE